MRAWTAVKAVGLAAALAVASVGTASAEEATVIASTSPSYSVGQALDDGQTINLVEGTGISVLTRSARVIELAGPYDAPIPGSGGSNTSVAENLAAAVFQTDDGSPEIGGVRGNEQAIQHLRPTAVLPGTMVDTEEGGATCVVEGNTLGLYRTPSGELGDWTAAEVTSHRTGDSAEVRWYSLEYNVLWPEDLNYESGDAFTISMANGAPVDFELYVLPATSNAGELVNMMAQHGCVGQIESVVAQLQTY